MDIAGGLDMVYRERRRLLFGYCLGILLYGILTVQTYLYYLAFPNDRKITKAIVIFVYTIDTAQTILALHDFYLLFCVIYKDYDLFADAYQSSFIWLTIPLSSSLIATVAQCFYAHRIYVLSKKKIITGIVIIIAMAQLSLGICSALDSHGSLPEGSGFLGMEGTIAWGAINILNDLIITVYMTWFLTIQMKRSSRRATQTTLTKIKRLVMETGLFTVAIAMVYSLLWIMNIEYEIAGLSLGKIYSNSMLVLLNNRFTIGGGRNEPTLEFEIQSFHLSDVPRRETNQIGTSPAEVT